jgi:hypothetical protein
MCDPTAGNSSNSCSIVYLDGAPSYPPSGPVFDSSWRGPFRQARPIQQAAALDLFLAGVEDGVGCEGQACSYDPAPAPATPLSCRDTPCPAGQTCCGFGGRFTCCNPGQACSQGQCR